MNHAVLIANNESGPCDHNIVPQAMFQVIKELYIRVTDPSGQTLGSAVQNQNEIDNDVVYMWQLCPKTQCVVLNLWQLRLPTTTECNELAVAVQLIVQEMSLETGAFMARALICRCAHHGERQPSSAGKKGQK